MSPEQQAVTAHPEITIEDYDKDCEFIVIACDGIWDCLTSQETVDVFSKKLKALEPNQSISTAIGEVFEQIIPEKVEADTVGLDNMTCAVI